MFQPVLDLQMFQPVLDLQMFQPVKERRHLERRCSAHAESQFRWDYERHDPEHGLRGSADGLSPFSAGRRRLGEVGRSMRWSQACLESFSCCSNSC
jgi:hypothetical protein